VGRFGDNLVSHLVLLDPDGRNASPLTEGDSTDGAPSWVPGKKDEIVYHSSGVSRDASGRVLGQSHYLIQHLDLATGCLETLLEDPNHDLLAPRRDIAGNLYFIRRPYEGPGGRRPPFWVTVKDVLLFPFRLARALVDFFQIFSQVVSRKPLTASGGPKSQGPEPARLWIHGRLVDANETAKRGDDTGAFAPSDWVLVRRAPDGGETVLARRVLTYDLAEDGRILCSDGQNVHILDGRGMRKVLSEPLTDTVKWIEPSMATVENRAA